jgi:16S rRNA processing protein RimM
VIRVGQVVGVFGVRGALKVASLTDFDDRFAGGSRLYLSGTPREVEWSRGQKAQLVVKLRGIDDRTVADGQRGEYLEVPEEAAHTLPDDAWYHDQLIGLDVRTASGRGLGSIAAVLENPANDVWVARGEIGETLFPAIREAVLSVDLEGRVVTIADWAVEFEDA